jgi:predicted nucleotidyltransferase
MDGDRQASRLLAQARKRSGLSQRDLATRAGVTQSVISMYESGRRQPALRTLATLIRAAGFDLDLHLLPATTASTGQRARLHQHRADVTAAAQRYGVTVRGVFGSVARGQARADSDIDLLLDVPDGVGLLTLARLERDLKQLLDTEVDLVPEAGLKPAVRERVLADLAPL